MLIQKPMKNIYCPSYYKTLGASPSATQDEIKTAYRKIIKIYHQDKNPNDPTAKEKSQAIIEANEILSNAEKRAKYDANLKVYVKAAEERVRRQHEAENKIRTPNPTAAFNFAAMMLIFLLIMGMFAAASSDNDKTIE
jgi:curved DNA-binding protein CbpA